MANDTKTQLPAELTMRMEFSIPSDYGTEYASFQEFLDDLRDYVLQALNDDAYNIVNSADVYDDKGELVAGDKFLFADED